MFAVESEDVAGQTEKVKKAAVPAVVPACPKPQKSIASMFLKPQKKKSVDKPADAVTKASELRDSPGNYSPHHTERGS